jgi:glycosyltransferase involved in cell wall biosynthesis
MIEAGMSGCALIVSDVSPYSPYITKENCLAIPHKGDWMKAIKQLNENPNQVHDLKEGLKEWAKDFRMEKINDIRWNALTNS